MIPAEAVEVAAMEINKRHGYAMPPWDELVKSKDRANRNRVKLDRDYARAALEAAAPYLMASMLEAGWQEPEKPYIDGGTIEAHDDVLPIPIPPCHQLPDVEVAEDARADLYEIISDSFYNEFKDPSGHTADAILAAGYRKVES